MVVILNDTSSLQELRMRTHIMQVAASRSVGWVIGMGLVVLFKEKTVQ